MSSSRTVRIFWDDPDLTDSSGEEDGCGAQRVGRMVRELPPMAAAAAPAPAAAAPVPDQCNASGDGDRGRRVPGVAGPAAGVCSRARRKVGKGGPGAPSTKFRSVWLDTVAVKLYDTAAEEATRVYDTAVIQLRGPNATTTFSAATNSGGSRAAGQQLQDAATPGGYESGAESSPAVSSPTSVLCKVPSQSSLAEDYSSKDDSSDAAAPCQPIECPRSLAVLEEEELGEFMLFEDAPVTPLAASRTSSPTSGSSMPSRRRRSRRGTPPSLLRPE